MRMILNRRIPGLIYTYRYRFYSVLAVSALLIFFLFKWNLLCTNLQAWNHVFHMCKHYEEHTALGSLCVPMCTNRDIHSLICHSFLSGGGAVFSGIWQNRKLLFKKAVSEDKEVHNLYWFNNGVKQYPSEKEFLSKIRYIVKNKLNQTLEHDSLVGLSRLNPHFNENDESKRPVEMNNIWILMQDNEYRLSKVFSDKDTFPQILGTCGQYFAVEYLEPLKQVSSLLSMHDSKEEWGNRLRLSIQIMELLEELEESFKDPIHLCNVKIEHFALSEGISRLKYIDLDGVYPRSVLNSILTNPANHCETDEDCDLYDCRSKCIIESKHCSKVVNNNVQIVCEKIFLGWRLSNTVIVPGLLLSQHLPSDLAAVLRECANPENESGQPRAVPQVELKKRLFNLLTEIEQSVNDF